MLPKISTSIPGPKSKKLLKKLRQSECAHVTYSDSGFPVFIRKARRSDVWDADGNRFVDLTSFFGVCSLGHANSVLQKAVSDQLKDGWHSMGDVHPHVLKVEAAEALKSILPEKLSRIFFSSSGSEAVETALKSAQLMTGRSSFVYCRGSYHGLGYGALSITDRDYFRKPFIGRNSFSNIRIEFTDFSASQSRVELNIDKISRILKQKKTAAVILELIQGRGGVRQAHPEWVRGLKQICRKYGTLLIFDEIFTGFGRTGKNFAFEHFGVQPDLLCLGKSMANGFPISACVMGKDVENAWGASTGEAKHTSTFLGHPLGCLMITQTVKLLKTASVKKDISRIDDAMSTLIQDLHDKYPEHIRSVSGLGAMRGIKFRPQINVFNLVKLLLKKGYIALPSGSESEVLSLTPPFCLSTKDLQSFFRELHLILKKN